MDAVLVWFCENIHDPYPSDATLASLSSATSRSVPSIIKQFVDLRRQVGWTSLIRTRFDGSRPAAVEAARRAHLRENSTYRLSVDLQSAFDSVKAKAEILAYGKPSSCQAAVGATQGTVVSSATPVTDVNVEDEELDTTPPPPVAGRKRRFDEASEGENASPSNPVVGRVSKRSRCVSSL